MSRSIQASDFLHPEFVALPADLSSGAPVRKVADDIVAQLGRIDVLVHAVGGFAGGMSVADTDDATLDRMLDLNYRSAFFMARAVLPHMRQQGGGRILAVASRQAVDPGATLGSIQTAIRKRRWWRWSAPSRWRTRTAASRRTRCCRARWIRRRTGPPTRKPINCSGCSRRRWPRSWCTWHQMPVRR